MRAHASASGSSGAGKPEISARMALVVLAQLIDLYMLIVLGAVIISWLKLPPTNTVAIVLHRLTEPAAPFAACLAPFAACCHRWAASTSRHLCC